MTKEELIKEAWGEYWSLFSTTTKERILLNKGSVDYFLLSNQERDNTEELIGDIRKLECTNTDEGTKRFFRPLSLKGIEDNNGWIKINNKEDLPKEDVHCYIISKYSENSIMEAYYITTSNKFHVDAIIQYDTNEVTHYQVINKPNLPLH